jgi:mono/diheme cytochrome c family protein
VTGNGQGPTAPWVNPHPRDYRRGLFKFVSTGKGTSGPPNRKPSRADLLRTLRQGIDGSSMPAFGAISGMTFGVLGDKELNQLVSYVIHLSIRGQVEFDVMAALKGGGDVDIATEVPERVGKIVGEWVTWADPALQLVPAKVEPTPEEKAELDKIVNGPLSDKKLLLTQLGGDSKNPLLNGKPYSEEQIAQLVAKLMADPQASMPDPKRPLHVEDVETLFRNSRLVSIERGYGAFMQNCAGACHVNFGRQDMLKWDDWGTIVRPANLTLGIYRGGRRPVDLYWRIHSGIPGSGMAALGDALATVKKKVKGTDGKEVEQEFKEPWRVWDVVNFVQALPYRSMLPGKPKKGEAEADVPKLLDLQELIHPLRQ